MTVEFHQRLFLARREIHPVPVYWDRDCRVCMARGNDFGRRGDWNNPERTPEERRCATVHIWQRTAEEFHSWHTDEELERYDAELDALSDEVKGRMGIK